MKKAVKKQLASGKVFELAGVKYGPRRKTFKHGKFEFNPATFTATSYVWWTFVKPFGKKIILNDGRYSVTTTQHQWSAKRLLDEMGINYITVDVGTENLNSMTVLAILRKIYMSLAIVEQKARTARKGAYDFSIKDLKSTIKQLIPIEGDISKKEKAAIIAEAERLNQKRLEENRAVRQSSYEKQKLKKQLLKTFTQSTNELVSNY